MNIYVRFIHFNASALGGVIISTGGLLFCVKVLNVNYLLGLIIAGTFSMIWNYLANRLFVWIPPAFEEE